MLKMTDIGYVAYIADLISEMSEITEQNVERDCRAGMSEMGIAVDCRSAYIHPYMTLMQGLEELFRAFQRVVEK